jgi:ferredoxin
VRVNPIKCTAFGFCAEFLPEVFDLDDWGYAWVQRPEMPLSLAEAARKAAKLCPTGAILVEVVEEPDTHESPAGRNLVSARGSRDRR